MSYRVVVSDWRIPREWTLGYTDERGEEVDLNAEGEPCTSGRELIDWLERDQACMGITDLEMEAIRNQVDMLE